MLKLVLPSSCGWIDALGLQRGGSLNPGSNLIDSLSDVDVFVDRRETKAKMNKQTYIKLKICAVKESSIKTRRQPSKWEKIFVNDISDKGLISEIGKEFIQFNNKKERWLKTGRGSEQIFFQKRYIRGQQAHEKMFNITNYQGNAKQKHNEIPPHTRQNG